ncbi:protein YgfX [Propionivibrio limicola]|uniref:protein YgfX n=1 Tax=Propionivibrio limicola TaxID=167645 RepID=UPI003CCD62D5
MQFPFNVELRRSVFLFVLLGFGHVLAVICVFVLPWFWYVKLASVLGVVGSYCWSLRRPRPNRLLVERNSTALFCTYGNGRETNWAVRKSSAVFPFLIVLNLHNQEDGRKCSLILLPDQVTLEQFRFLKVWLRWNFSGGSPL